MIGIYIPDFAKKLQPPGLIFLNQLFMIIVPLVGISIMSSIASMTDLKRLGKIMLLIFIVSIAMAAIPAAGIIGLALWYNPAQGVLIDLSQSMKASSNMDFVSMITTSDFVGLFYKSNILAIILISIITGIAIGQSGDSGKRMSLLLNDANNVIMQIVGMIMKVAATGLGCYSGNHDYLLRVLVESLSDYEHFIRKRLQPLPGIASIDTSFAYRVVKQSYVYPKKR